MHIKQTYSRNLHGHFTFVDVIVLKPHFYVNYYRIDPKYSDRHAGSNNEDPDLRRMMRCLIRFTLFATKLSILDTYVMAFKLEPAHDNTICATSEDSDQPAHPRSLTRVFSSLHAIHTGIN